MVIVARSLVLGGCAPDWFWRTSEVAVSSDDAITKIYAPDSATSGAMSSRERTLEAQQLRETQLLEPIPRSILLRCYYEC
jgi:hypothetical protein